MKIAIVGASGAVGQELIALVPYLEKSAGLTVDEVRLFGSDRSADRDYTVNGRTVTVRRLRHDDADFADLDFVFVSAGASVSREYADTITSGGALMIDNSSAFRMDDDVPLVVPEVNGADALDAPRRIIANPNCTTIQMVVALKPLHDISPIKSVHVATYQAASGAGAAAMHELTAQHTAIARGEQPEVERFAHQLAFNVIPHIDIFGDNDYTREEMKMHHETKKIMHAPGIEVSATCVRVPVMRAHSEAIWACTENEITPVQAREAFAAADGITLIDNPAENLYPMPLDAAGSYPIWVGRVRKDLAQRNSLTFWCVGDQLLKGAALNAMQIAVYIARHNTD